MPGGDDAAPVAVPAGGRARAVTGGVAEHRRVAIPIDVIELDDALFCEGSAVLMPERVAADDADEEAEELPGPFQLIALAYKQFEMDDRKKMLVAGHCASAASAAANRELSQHRARSVLFLLTGERDRWGEYSANHHGLIDYKRVLKYFSREKGWRCDPGELNTEWNDTTAAAVQRFFNRYNSQFASRSRGARVPRDIHTIISSDDDKHWPAEAWVAVYNLYIDEIRRALSVTLTQMNTLRGMHQYAHANKFVGCGDRHPVHADYEDNYRSESVDRVEILFVNQDISRLDCPAAPAAGGEFPFCHRGNYTLTFVSLDDLTAVPYHLKFTYYDRVKNAVTPVPNVLTIKAFTRRNREITGVRKAFNDGVYTVKVPESQISREIYFTFETVPAEPRPPADTKFLFTANADATPEMRPLTPVQVTALTPRNRLKHYDLPHKWSSRNYWTRYRRGDSDQGNRFQQVVSRTLRLKPYGSAKTKASEPLGFSLDDIVLVNETRNQNLTDLREDGRRTIALNNQSRYTLFHVEHRALADMPEVSYDKKKLKALRIYDPDTDNPVFTRGDLRQNLIHKVPNDTRVICFAGGFYDVFDKRTAEGDPQFNLSNGRHILGARMALLEDADVHVKKVVDGQNDADAVTKAYALRRPGLNACGNYELHYFHNCAELNNKPLSYLFVYWSCRLRRVNQSGGIVRGTTTDVTNHRKEGMVNAMKRLNKDYLIEKHTGGNDIIIRPFHFMEAKMAGRGGKHKALVNIVRNTNSSGADAGAWMSPEVAQLRGRDYEDDPDYLGVGDPDNAAQDVDGSTYAVLTNQHEFGHATGNWDDYLYDLQAGSAVAGESWQGLPRYNQPFTAEGGPYTCDKLSRMRVNRTPRLRNFWKFVSWLHDDSADNTKPLHPFFHGTRFKLTFVGSSHTHAFHLAEAHRNVAAASHSAINRVLDTDVTTDLLLYKLGDGELSRLLHSGQVFDAILVVRTKYAFKFVHIGTDKWTQIGARDWMRGLNDDLRTMLNGTDGKFRIACGGADNGFKNIYMYFVPHFDVYEIDSSDTPAIAYTSTPPADSHFNVEVTFVLGSSFSNTNKLVELSWGLTADSGAAMREKLIRHSFGETGTGNLTRTNFPQILSWVQSELGDATHTYAIHDL